jgi:hypothetical protein
MLEALKNGLNHHAYLLEGDITPSYEALQKALRENEIEIFGNPDVLIKEYENILIDDVREIKDFESERRVQKTGRKIIILKTRSFSYPAQNALLKVFEEPREGVVFFLIMPESSKLFPTLRSRLFGLTGEYAVESELRAEASEFLKSNKKKRLDFLKKFTDMDSKILLKEKTIKFLNFLESELAKGEIKINKNSIEDVYLAKKYIGDQGSSPKILLEHLAVTI